jgi:hypothetical protein
MKHFLALWVNNVLLFFNNRWKSHLHRSILLGSSITSGWVDRVVAYMKEEKNLGSRLD